MLSRKYVGSPFLHLLCVKLFTNMDLHAKSCSMQPNSDHSSIVVSIWLKFRCTIVTVLYSSMKLVVIARITHKFGYSLRGESAVDHRWLHRGMRISATAAMSTSGMLAVELMSGSVTSDKFFDHVKEI